MSDPTTTGRWQRAASGAYRHLRRLYGRDAVRYQSYEPGWHGPKTPPQGDCFMVAFQTAVTDPPDTDGWTLVHGLVTGPPGRHCHAWAEYDGAVYDYSNGKELEIPRELYYALGHINEAECYRYTAHEAGLHALRTGHYGPWEGQAWEQ